MGVLKLSVIEEKERLRTEKLAKEANFQKNGRKLHRISACSCPCECFVKDGEITNDIGETASWNID